MLQGDMGDFNNSLIKFNSPTNDNEKSIFNPEKALYELINLPKEQKIKLLENIKEKVTYTEEADNLVPQNKLAPIEFTEWSEQIINANKLTDILFYRFRQCMYLAYAINPEPNVSVKDLDTFTKMDQVLSRGIDERAKKAFLNLLENVDNIGSESSRFYKRLAFNVSPSTSLDKFIDKLSPLDPFNELVDKLISKGFDFNAKLPDSEFNKAGTYSSILEDLVRNHKDSALFSFALKKYGEEKLIDVELGKYKDLEGPGSEVVTQAELQEFIKKAREAWKGDVKVEYKDGKDNINFLRSSNLYTFNLDVEEPLKQR